MNRERRPLAAPALLLVLVLLLGSACSGGSSADTGTGTSTATSADSHAQGVKFSECMRENGVSDFPDPDPDGDFTYGVSVSAEQWQKSVNTCKDLQPPGTLSGKRDPTQQSAALVFAQCVRDNGVKDFPDPVNGDPLIDTTKIPSSDGPDGMRILNAAIQTCRDLLDEAARSKP